MKKYEKRILMLFRGDDESNKISSSTKNIFQEEGLSDFVEMDFINLDKRNLKKYLNNSEISPNIIYIWHKEESIINYLKSNYPNIELRIYSMKNSSKQYLDSYNHRTIIYTVFSNILEEYKRYLGTITLWTIENFEVKKIIKDIYDYETMDKHIKKDCYLSEEDCKMALEHKIEFEIKSCNDIIANTNKKKEYLKELQKNI